MFSKSELEKLVYFDIETVTGHKDASGLTEKEMQLWSKRCGYLRERFEDNKEKTDEDLYEYKAALHAEYSKVVCVSFGRLNIDDKTPKEIKKIKKLAMSHNISLKEKRKLYCRKCFDPYKNPKIRIKKGIKSVECKKCNYISRWKLN